MICKYCKKEIQTLNLFEVKQNTCIVLCDNCIKTTKGQCKLWD